MTLTIDSTLRDNAILRREAKRRDMDVKRLASQIFAEAVEDLADAAAAEKILSKTDPQEWRSLDDLRRAVRG